MCYACRSKGGSLTDAGSIPAASTKRSKKSATPKRVAIFLLRSWTRWVESNPRERVRLTYRDVLMPREAGCRERHRRPHHILLQLSDLIREITADTPQCMKEKTCFQVLSLNCPRNKTRTHPPYQTPWLWPVCHQQSGSLEACLQGT